MITNDRNKKDWSHVQPIFWPGILIGTDGYPKIWNGDYVITGGDQDFGFKATAIEFYGVKTKAR